MVRHLLRTDPSRDRSGSVASPTTLGSEDLCLENGGPKHATVFVYRYKRLNCTENRPVQTATNLNSKRRAMGTADSQIANRTVCAESRGAVNWID